MSRLTSQKNINNQATSQPIISLGGLGLSENFRIQSKTELASTQNVFLTPIFPPFERKQAEFLNPIQFSIIADNILPNITVDTTKTFTNNTNVTADRT